MNKKILIIIALCSSLISEEIWVDDIAALYYGQKMMQEASIKEKKVSQDEILKLSCLRSGEIFELKDRSLKESCDAIFVELKSVYYTKTLFGTRKISKDRAKMPLNSFLSIESIKKIYRSDAVKLFNTPFELSPRAALKNIKVGDRVRLMVTSFGRAKAGANITYNNRIVAKSDRDGYASVEMRESGLQRVTASYTQKGDGIRCDEIIHSTTLNIEVSKP